MSRYDVIDHFLASRFQSVNINLSILENLYCPAVKDFLPCAEFIEPGYAVTAKRQSIAVKLRRPTSISQFSRHV